MAGAVPSARSGVNVTLSLLFIVFAASVALRLGFGALLLNEFMNYTTIEGSTIEKIHPAFYGIALVAVAIGLTQRVVLSVRDLAILRAIIVFIVGIVGILAMMLLVNGQSSSSGYILDTYIVTCLASFVMMALPEAWRVRLGELVLLFLTLSALVGIAEFVLRARLLPYPGGEEVFRPTGLSDHPLQLGMWCAVGICFAPILRWPLRQFVTVAILLVGALASGARVASIAACFSSVIYLIFARMPAPTSADAFQRKVMLAIAGLCGLIAVIAVMAAVGALDRLLGGLVDQSSLARVGIYGVFDYLTWREFLLGSDIVRVQRIARDVLDIPYIESSFVVFTVQFGLIGAIVFALLLGNLVRAWLIGRAMPTIIGTLIFFTLALTNNLLSVKSADVLILGLLIMSDCSRRQGAGRS